MRSHMKPYLILSIFIFLYILTLNTSVQCRPNHRYKNVKRHYHSGENKPHTITAEKAIERKYMDEKTAPCFQDIELMTICQRCARDTKSDVAFPMCCSNEDQTRKFCIDFHNFGNR